MSRFNNLAIIQVKLISQQLQTKCLLPYLNASMMFALTQFRGKTLSDNDLSKISVCGLASSAAPSLSKQGQIPSGPHVLLVSKTDSSENTSEAVTGKESKVNLSSVRKSDTLGKLKRTSLVKTDINLILIK